MTSCTWLYSTTQPRWLVPVASEIAYTHLQTTDGRYIEPFLGGGAVAADLGLPNMLLADLCTPLINAFSQVRRNANAVLWSLNNYKRRGTDSRIEWSKGRLNCSRRTCDYVKRLPSEPKRRRRYERVSGSSK